MRSKKSYNTLTIQKVKTAGENFLTKPADATLPLTKTAAH